MYHWHVSIHLIMITVTLFNIITILFMLSLLYHSLYYTLILFIYLVLIIIWLYSTSISFIIHLLIYILNDLYYNLTLYLYQYMQYIHLIWVWGHMEVYIMLIPNLTVILLCIISCHHYTIIDHNTIIISLYNISILSIITFIHHI